MTLSHTLSFIYTQGHELTITLIVAGRLMNQYPVTSLMPPSAVPDKITADFIIATNPEKQGF